MSGIHSNYRHQWLRSAAYVFCPRLGLVAQIFNLLYRRFVIGMASASSNALIVANGLQNTILRYGRLKICATVTTYTATRSLSIVTLVFATACNRVPPPPEAVSLAAAPGALEKAFSNSKSQPEVKALVGQALAALQANNYVEAAAALRQLCAVPELTESERIVATRCQLALNQELQAAQSRSDEQAAPAAQAVKTYQLLK